MESTAVVIEGKDWQKDLPDLGDLEVFVAPWENAEFEKVTTKLTRALPAALRPDGVAEPNSWYIIVGKGIARTVLFDWKNYKIGGVEKPFDAKFAETVLTDRRYRTVRDGVIAAAKRVQLGVKTEEAAVVGNSPTSSPGSATGAAKSSA
jgi:hypothetical protein